MTLLATLKNSRATKNFGKQTVVADDPWCSDAAVAVRETASNSDLEAIDVDQCGTALSARL